MDGLSLKLNWNTVWNQLSKNGCDLGSWKHTYIANAFISALLRHISLKKNDISNNHSTSQFLYLWLFGHCFQSSSFQVLQMKSWVNIIVELKKNKICSSFVTHLASGNIVRNAPLVYNKYHVCTAFHLNFFSIFEIPFSEGDHVFLSVFYIKQKPDLGI